MSAVLKKIAPKEEPLEPSELWLALTALPRPTKTLPIPRNIPGTDQPIGEVVVWPLTQEEQMAANAAADRFTKDLMRDPQKKDEANLGYHHTYTNEVAIQILHRACRDPNNIERPAFPSPMLMRAKFTTDEIGVLFSGYCTIQSELGPIRAFLSKEETEGMIIRLAEGGSAFPIDGLSWEQQRALVLTLACRIVDYWTAMSSAGLPLDVSTTASSYLQDRKPEDTAEPDEEDPDSTEDN